MGTDTPLLKATLAQSLTSIVVGVVVFSGAILLMALINPLLLVVALACVAVATAVVLAVATKVREAQERVEALGAALERTMRAIRTVKISRVEGREEEAISGEARAAYEALIGPATNVALQGSFVPVLGVGGARLASEALVVFLLYLLYVVGPLVLVFASFTELQQGLAAMGRIREVLESPVEADPAGGVAEPGVEAVPAVRLDRVCFGYGPVRPVLEGVSFEIPCPGLTTLVGRSGAGKSTVFALLSRFYDAESGSVQVGGTDVRHLPLNELHARVAYVEQDVPVLAGTVRQNLPYASRGASEEELEEVIAWPTPAPLRGSCQEAARPRSATTGSCSPAKNARG